MSHEDAMSVLLLDYKFLRSKEFSFLRGTGRKGSKRGRDRANPWEWSASPPIFTRGICVVRCHTGELGECKKSSAQTI